MLKFQKKSDFGYLNNHISEYLGSKFFEMMGFETQEVFLATYKNENVVACKDFNSLDTQFVPFNGIGESTLEQDKETYQYTYDDITRMLADNSKLTDVKETTETFWKIFIVDAILGNFDRHGGNWGFLKSNGKYRLAPVFDNGSCLFPQMTDEDMMLRIIDSEELTNERIYKFPTSQIKLHGRKSSYFDVISSLHYEECNKALRTVYEATSLEQFDSVVDVIDSISDVNKAFLRYLVHKRFEKIVEYSYRKLIG